MIPTYSTFPNGFSLFRCRSQRSARMSIVGRYSTINSVSALTRIYRVTRGSVQRTEETLPHVLFTRRLFLFRRGQEPSLFQLYRVPLEIYSSLSWLAAPFLPSCDVHVREAEKSTLARLFVRGPRYYFANKSCAIRCGIKQHRRQLFYESELHLIYRYSANDGCKAFCTPFFLIQDFLLRIVCTFVLYFYF